MLRDRAIFLGSSFIVKHLSVGTHPCNKVVKEYSRKNKKSKLKKTSVLEIFICEVSDMIKDVIFTSVQNEMHIHQLEDLTSDVPVDLELGKSLQGVPNPDDLVRLYYEEKCSPPIYTDSTLIPRNRSVGWAAVSPEDGYSVSSSVTNYASIFMAEMMALSRALSWASLNTDQRHVILSDSQSASLVLKSTTLCNFRNPLVIEAKSRVASIRKQSILEKPITLTWILAHIGIQGNEMADQLAKVALTKVPSHTRIPSSDIKRI